MTHHTHKLHITQTISVEVSAPKPTDASLLALAWANLMVDKARHSLDNVTVNGLEQRATLIGHTHPDDCEKESCQIPW